MRGDFVKYNEHIENKHYHIAFSKELSSRDEAYGGASFQERYNDPELRNLVKKAHIALNSSVLVIGTGTGADACWLADNDFHVTAIDFIKTAIEMAESIAAKRGSVVEYHWDDVCHIRNDYINFDAIIDHYCLQNIVPDADRAYVFKFVRAHLQPNGKYLIISAGYAPEKGYNENYQRDEQTGVVIQIVKDDELHLEDICIVGDRKLVPVRRHHTVETICRELRENGFEIIEAEGIPGDGALRVIAKDKAI
jgi:cyclopropane fatty-acyl-phospholipid synthase-like methyltransferase